MNIEELFLLAFNIDRYLFSNEICDLELVITNLNSFKLTLIFKNDITTCDEKLIKKHFNKSKCCDNYMFRPESICFYFINSEQKKNIIICEGRIFNLKGSKL